MAVLSSALRNQLSRVIQAARRDAEAGARKALQALAIDRPDPHTSMSGGDKALRNRLRAHGRQLGDARLQNRSQSIDCLGHEVAYEHWHRMLFARFLAENHLLVEPDSGVAISMADCQDLSRERSEDPWSLAGRFAQRMLPRIFRPDDPALEVDLAPENRQALERHLESLPVAVFTADDSLGWTYQFWQAEKKDEVNASGVKIGAAELSAVTQLFTEDYMVEFLLHNTIGAWWAAKLAPIRAADESEARAKAGLPSKDGLDGITWTFLRFVRDEATNVWTPASGTYEGWPRTAKDIRLLDPCMGSGHFLVFFLRLLARLRMEEEGLIAAQAVYVTLRDNIYGLELDPRCVQLGAFNLAVEAWKRVGWQELPALNVACSGLAPHAPETDWVEVAGDNDRLQRGMVRLYALFKDAPILGSLIAPRAIGSNLVAADFHELHPLLAQVVQTDRSPDADRAELGVMAKGLAKAADILAGEFTLVATNVPYLGRGKQAHVLKEYCERIHPDAKTDLATCFIERCLEFCVRSGTVALVTPQNWWFSPGYSAFRRRLLSQSALHLLATLGEEAWRSFGDRGPVASLMIASRMQPADSVTVAGVDALPKRTIDAKILELQCGLLYALRQSELIANPDCRLAFEPVNSHNLLANSCESWQGLVTSDNPRFMLCFWEAWGNGWDPYISSPARTRMFGGRENVIAWMDAAGPLHSEGKAHNFPPKSALRKRGVLLSQVRSLSSTIYTGEIFAHGSSPVIPAAESMLPALWCFLSSDEYRAAVRNIDKKLAVTNSTLLKVEFDAARWRAVAVEEYPQGLPKPVSTDPTQWLFDGRPNGSEQPLHVAVARLVGYRWPRQAGSSFLDCSPIGPDDLDPYADAEGIVCLSPLNGQEPAVARLRAVLATAFGPVWGAAKERDLLSASGSRKTTIEEWLRDEFFEQHCALFHQRPFVWHLWDGRQDGFHAFVNYHRVVDARGRGRTVLEKLAYSYLGDHIDRQTRDQQAGIEGAEGRLAAAVHLRRELEMIAEGAPPYDIFVRWKALAEQPVGWEPDVNDGVRVNIRPFLIARPLGARVRNACLLRTTPRINWDKDRGKDPRNLRPIAGFPWFWGCPSEGSLEERTDFMGGKEFDGNRWNDLHYSNDVKLAARERATKDGGE